MYHFLEYVDYFSNEIKPLHFSTPKGGRKVCLVYILGKWKTRCVMIVICCRWAQLARGRGVQKRNALGCCGIVRRLCWNLIGRIRSYQILLLPLRRKPAILVNISHQIKYYRIMVPKHLLKANVYCTESEYTRLLANSCNTWYVVANWQPRWPNRFYTTWP